MDFPLISLKKLTSDLVGGVTNKHVQSKRHRPLWVNCEKMFIKTEWRYYKKVPHFYDRHPICDYAKKKNC